MDVRLYYPAAAEVQQAVLARLARFPREPRPVSRGLRSACAISCRALLRAYNRPRFVGLEYLPAERSFVIVANHTSHLDTLCLLSALPLRRLHRTYPAAAADYFFTSLPRVATALVVNAVPFDRRGGGVHESMSRCRELIADRAAGNVLIVYPEGTRGDGRDVGAFKRGVGDLVAGRDVPVVPCFIDGACRAWPKGAWIPRPFGVRVSFGRPRTYAHLERSKSTAQLVSEDLRDAVLRLKQSQNPQTSETALTVSEVIR